MTIALHSSFRNGTRYDTRRPYQEPLNRVETVYIPEKNFRGYSDQTVWQAHREVSKDLILDRNCTLTKFSVLKKIQNIRTLQQSLPVFKQVKRSVSAITR